jgi:hypothetical protein
MKVSSGSALLEGDIEMGLSKSSDLGYEVVSQTDPVDLNAGRGLEITDEEALRESQFSDEEDRNDFFQSQNASLSRSSRIFKYFTDLTIPHGQYVYGAHIMLASFLAAIRIDKNDEYSKILSVLAYTLSRNSVPRYFGYELTVSFQMNEPVSVGGHRRYFGIFIFKKLTFPSYRMVSFASWLNGLVLSVTTFLVFLPPDCYKNLENNYHFQEFLVIVILYCIQTIIYTQSL